MLPTSVAGYYKKRREILGKKDSSAAFFFPSNREYIRNDDVHYDFRQDSSLYYLTGFPEPESFLALLPSSEGGKSHRSILFVRQRNPEREIWDGERYGVDGALNVFGVDATYPIEELEDQLPELMKGVEKVFYRANLDETMDRRIYSVLETYRRGHGRSGRGLVPIQDPREHVGEMRLFKDSDEIELLCRASKITADSHSELMRHVKPGMNEFEIEALIDYLFRSKGCQRLGYGSIVAGGKNATCLHYRSNNETLRDGDLLLIDAGGEYGYYTSDITRTFPVGKKFSDQQAKFYDVVLKAQMECIAMVKPGVVYSTIHQHACLSLTEGLLSLGLLKGKTEELIQSNAFRRFFPHGTGHWLGMDVHDCGLYTQGGESRKLEPGMCFTIEPGLYVQPGDVEASEEFRGLGVRIEDDILVTSSGCEVLTKDVPKTRADIEALREKAFR